MQTQQTCPEAEMYIGVVYKGQYEKFEVKDIEIRRADRTQFVTGVRSTKSSAMPLAPYDIQHCFIARITTRGDYEKGSYLYYDPNHDTLCYNLALIPRLHYLVAVGYFKVRAATPRRAMIYLADQDMNLKALKYWTKTNDAYSLGSANVISTEATDVQVAEADGSIYVTGNIENSYTIGPYTSTGNCFVMRVDTELNLIYVKSFGEKLSIPTTSFLTCYSLQITRNADFMYFGGYQTTATSKNLFFSKSNGQGDFMVTTAIKPTSTDQFTFRRILLDKGNKFDLTNPDKLYFCGTISYAGGTNSDFMYGLITSDDVETFANETAAPLSSALITVKKIYTYGQTGKEINGDCAMSDDNLNLMVVFSTSYHTPYSSTRIWKWDADDTVAYLHDVTPTYYYYSNANLFTYPGGCGCGVNQNYFNNWGSLNSMLSVSAGNFYPNQIPLIRADCEDPIRDRIINYAAIYDTQLFSWHECTNYWWAFNAVDDCQIQYLRFDPYCDGTQRDNDNVCGCGGCGPGCGGCGGGGCQTPGQPCDPFIGYANDKRPWYTQYCHTEEQRKNIYTKTIAAQDYIRQFMHCYDSSTANSAPPAGTCGQEDDEFFLIFEQDCLPQGQNQNSIFVARFTLSDITTPAHVTSNPSIAAYLGDTSGNLESSSIALDQYGFVYVHAYSDAPGFGAQPSPSATQQQFTWVHVKTHWEIGGEYEFQRIQQISNPGKTVDYQQAGITMGAGVGASWTQWFGKSEDNSAAERPPSFISKKFTVPKKFKNVYSPKPLAQQVIFLKEYHDSVANSGSASYPLAKAYMVNEELYDKITYTPFSFSLTNIAAVSFIWGYSYAKTSKTEDIHFYVDSTNSGLSPAEMAIFNVPHICVSSLSYAAGDWYQNYYRQGITGKNSWILTTTTAPLTSLGGNFNLKGSGYRTLQSGSELLNLELSIEISSFSTLTEGLYYFDIRVATDDRSWDTTAKHCTHPQHGFFWNTDQFSGRDYTYIRRFEASYRVRIFVDLETITAPANIKNIEDIFPVVGLKSELALKSGGVDKYFQGCDRYYAKQQKLEITNAALVTFNTEALPHWIKFFERNQTFQFYPIIYSPHRIISVEVSCCNSIEQCATQTFHVDVQNTPPVSDFAQTNTYVLQYDAAETVGQEFQWEMRNTYFYDVDKGSNSLNTTTYNNKDTENTRTDHTVDMDFTDLVTSFSSQFRHIKRLGLIFGQGSSSIYGVKLLNYQFRDNFVTTSLQAGYLKVLINRMPTVTSTGTSYQLTQIDPKQFGKTTYFDKWFPFLNNDDLLVFEVDTSPWFTDDSTDILTYGLTRSDNTARPTWIEFDVVSGKMTGFPNQTEQSELLQLKFTVQDQQLGTNKVYKQMLINSKPQAATLYKVIEVGVNRQFATNVSELIWDYNGDPITFSVPQSTDQVKLAAYSISFSDATKLIYGKPTLQGTIALIKLRGTDTHGSFVDVYLTLKIDDYQPNKRSNVRFPDRQIYEYQRFEFKLEDSLFYDQKDYATLVLFAYDPADQPLPQWLNFMPHSRIFNGIAPKRNTEQVVVVRAINTITHDSLSVTFRIQVIPNPNPKTRFIYMPDDLQIKQDSWIDHQVPIQLFKDANDNYMPLLYIFPVNGAKFPSFLKFNPTNRTIYGKANETGSFVVDFVYQDDQGRKTYSNLRIIVTPVSYSLPNKYYYHFGIAGSAFLSIVIFIGYVYHTNSLLSEGYKIEENTEKDAAEARKRFGEYREIDIKFKKPQPRALDHIRQARLAEKIKYTGGEAGAMSARTYDYNFIVDEHTNSSLENTVTSILHKKSESKSKYQDRWDDQKPNETLSHRVSMQQKQLRRIGQKTKISSL